MPRLTRKQMLAAETFGYSYAQYKRRFVGSDEPWLNDVDIFEKAEQEGWNASRLAQAVDICEEDVWYFQRAYREGKDIVDAPTPAEWFRRSVRYAVQGAVEDGLTSRESIEGLVNHICYRTAGLGFCLDMEGKQLSDYLEELRKEAEYGPRVESKGVADATIPAERFRCAVRHSIQTAIQEGLADKGAIERLVSQICHHVAEFGFSLDLENERLSDYSEELREREKTAPKEDRSHSVRIASVGEGIQKGLAGFNGALAGVIAGAAFGGFSDVVSLVEGVVFMAALGAFIAVGGTLKGMSRRIAYGRGPEPPGLLGKMARSAAVVASLYGLVGLLVGVTQLLLGRVVEGIAIWAIIGTLEGCAAGIALWRLGAG